MKYLKVNEELTNDNELVLDTYIALYGGSDLTGERFTKNTQFESVYTRQGFVAVDWEHGLEPDDVKTQPTRDDIFGTVNWGTHKSDDIGLLAQSVLDRREAYVTDFIEPLARAGLLGTSSESIPKKIRKTADGTIEAWPLKRLTLTVNPAEIRMLNDHQVEVIKSLVDEMPALKSLLPTDAKDGMEKNTLQGNEKNNPDNGDNQMNEKEIKALIDAAVEAALASQEQPNFEELIAKAGKSAGEEAVKAYLAQQDETIAPKKGSIEFLEDEADKAVKANPYKLGATMQAVKTAIVSPSNLSYEQKAILGANESIPQEGGFLVGTEMDGGLEKKMHDSAVFSSRAALRTIGEGANSVDFFGVKENSRATGSRFGGVRGYRVAEGQTITASSMKFYKFTLKPSKYAAVTYGTNEVLNDSRLLEQEVMESIPLELAFMLDDDMLNGVSAGYPKGITRADSFIEEPKEGGQAATTIVAENIINMWARVWARSKPNAVWFINSDVTPQLHKLNLPVGTGGALVYMPPGGLSSAPFGTLYGRPVIETEFNETLGTVGDIIVADWSQYKLATVGGLKAASSIHVQFLTDQSTFRFTVRYDGQSSWEKDLTPYKGTQTVSPFVGLATRS